MSKKLFLLLISGLLLTGCEDNSVDNTVVTTTGTTSSVVVSSSSTTESTTVSTITTSKKTIDTRKTIETTGMTKFTTGIVSDPTKATTKVVTPPSKKVTTTTTTKTIEYFEIPWDIINDGTYEQFAKEHGITFKFVADDKYKCNSYFEPSKNPKDYLYKRGDVVTAYGFYSEKNDNKFTFGACGEN